MNRWELFTRQELDELLLGLYASGIQYVQADSKLARKIEYEIKEELRKKNA